MEEISNPNSVPDGAPGVGETVSRPGTGKVWSVEGDEALEKQNPAMYDGDGMSKGMYDGDGMSKGMYDGGDDISPRNMEEGLSEEDTKILLEKEFDDYYEDRAHKSAGES